jgi:hypothetical protein
LELEVEAQEKAVGPFSADILCKDVVTDRWVLIENQLERTNHTHLGQLLTYAAGLEAVTIVWLASRFTEEHQAALDWLNQITEERFNFFGLEIELWRIGDSPIAPKFNVVCKPNDWTRTIQGAAKQIQTESLTDTKRLQLDFWTSFARYVEENSSTIRPQKPLPQHWMNMAVGRSGFHLTAIFSFWRPDPTPSEPHEIRAEFVCDGSNAKEYFALLEAQRSEIERELGEPLVWHNPLDAKSCKMYISQPVNAMEMDAWQQYQEWLLGKLERLRAVFSPRVRSLILPQVQAV